MMKKDREIDTLLKSAITARKEAYIPFSGFRVGAAVLGTSGKIYNGCNVENSSYGLTICAERVAIFKAISEGERRFKAIVIIADTEKPITPCGACRQVMAEFNPDMKIITANINGEKKKKRLSEIFPEPFRGKYIG